MKQPSLCTLSARLLAAGSLAVAFAFGTCPPAAAQADAPATGAILCDSGLLLNLYIADYYFNFADMRSLLLESGVNFTFAQADDGSVLPLDAYAQGQYAPLFASLTTTPALPEDTTAPPGSSDRETGLLAALMMPAEEMQAAMAALLPPGESALLPAPPAIEEAAACAALRGELTHFYQAVAYYNLMSGPASG